MSSYSVSSVPLLAPLKADRADAGQMGLSESLGITAWKTLSLNTFVLECVINSILYPHM